MTDLAVAGVAETARLVAGGEVTARAVVEAALARIDERDRELNAFSRVLADEALAEADARDAARRPAATARCTAYRSRSRRRSTSRAPSRRSAATANSTPAAADAEVVARLRAAGAVVIGKTTMPEFGAFPFTESVSRGITRNPWDRTRTPGGSSGGTAVAVASGMVRSAWAATAAARSGSRAPAAGCSGSSRSAAGSPRRRTRTCGSRWAPPGR